MATQKIRVGLEKSTKLSFPFNTNHKESTHRYFNAVKLWNNSLVKFVSLFLERTLKYEINNRNLFHKLEGIHSRNCPIWGKASIENFTA